MHSGDLHGGHYFALLKPERDGAWFRFDDDRVTPVTLKEVLDENYGGGESAENLSTMSPALRQLNRHKRFTNAYMLVYVKNNDMDEILKPLTKEDIPEHLQRRLDQERADIETKNMQRLESNLHFNARVMSDADFKTHDGFDLMDPHSAKVGTIFKVRKAHSFAAFKHEVAEAFGIPEEEVRLWTLVKRQNDTIRTDVPIPDSELKNGKQSLCWSVYWSLLVREVSYLSQHVDYVS